MWDGFNQRKFPRIQLKCEVTIHVEKGRKVINAVTENVGTGGVCIVQSEPLERFEAVKVRLEMDGQGSIECPARICWIIGRKIPGSSKIAAYDTGIEFVGLSQAKQDQLKHFIEDRIDKGFKVLA
ncbi:MAG: PilZ domain-containing protein [Candidatus Omnitrophota bacterium]